jgi:hypothetical protein
LKGKKTWIQANIQKVIEKNFKHQKAFPNHIAFNSKATYGLSTIRNKTRKAKIEATRKNQESGFKV